MAPNHPTNHVEIELPSTMQNPPPDPPSSQQQEDNHGQPTIETSQDWDFDIYTKIISCGFSFFVAGLNDGCLGALIPYLLRSYAINTAKVSIIYALSFLGWLTAALVATHLTTLLALGSLLTLGAILQVLSHTLRVWNPPFALFVASFWLTTFGQGLQDMHANSYIATIKRAHRGLGFIHAMYMAGCLVAPFVATAIAARGTQRTGLVPADGKEGRETWFLYYWVPLGMGVGNCAGTMWAFRETLGVKRRRDGEHGGYGDGEVGIDDRQQQGSRNRGALRTIGQTLRLSSVWLLSLYFFFFIGASLTASGWIVEYLVMVRDGNLAEMGYVPAGFSGGCLLGRLVLAEPTHRWGERKMVFIYSIICLGFQLLFWLVPNIIAASVAISLLGFFAGPFFAAGVSVGSKLFPAELHSTALGFVFVFGQVGGTVFPVLTGVVAAHSGVGILQPILTGLFGATIVSWFLVPKKPNVHEE